MCHFLMITVIYLIITKKCIILLKQENQQMTVATILAATIPYSMDSNVNGFPLGKYAITVTPS